MIVAGVKFIMSPPKTNSTRAVSSLSFGADYYTEEYRATKAAVDNASTIAENIKELGKSISFYVGSFYVFSGVLVILSFGKKVSSNKAIGTNKVSDSEMIQ